MAQRTETRTSLVEAAETLESIVKEKLADVREMHDQELRCQIAIQKLEEEIAGLKVKRRTESGKARFLYDQANTLRQQAADVKAFNPWVKDARTILREKAADQHYGVENSSETPRLLSFDLTSVNDDVKIATVICHSPGVAGGVQLFSVAGYRTKNGSPNTPFDSLEAAIDCALAMERWDPEKHTMFPQYPGETPGVNALGQTVPAGDAEGRL